ncbi:division/cell wall cluster transcriptional repressor MraZ [Rickettsiella endosymbiont of Litargus connexus]|jgi:MraZ protein|uniref:division/cell wall cluster transcriptional repressor MraZ n=1 Tax=Rickettsiella endosymbiont of Litargus connexus TaxID=3066237 RepID=UPI00376F1531|nr:division/cell wall cluster transcriptional repressor MraZ [Gammaproteobacteria bacterium]
MFRGINLVVLDAKGRIKLPVRYRQLLPTDKEPQLVLTIDTESPCLLLYPLQEWEIIEEKLQALPSFNPAVRRIQRLLIGHATDLDVDTNGRVLLPAVLRNYAHLEKEIMVVGQGRKIELWSAREWDDYRIQWISETVKPEELPDELQNLAL